MLRILRAKEQLLVEFIHKEVVEKFYPGIELFLQGATP